jgi:hypothetical protein
MTDSPLIKETKVGDFRIYNITELMKFLEFLTEIGVDEEIIIKIHMKIADYLFLKDDKNE